MQANMQKRKDWDNILVWEVFATFMATKEAT